MRNLLRSPKKSRPRANSSFLPVPTKSSSEDDSSRADEDVGNPAPKHAPTRRKASLTSVKKRRRPKRNSASESPAKDESSGWEDEVEDKEDEWSDEPDEPKYKPKTGKAKAKAKEQDEAQKKREMFAKQQIFGKGPSPGLLSGMLRTGGSMVDLVGHPTTDTADRSRPKRLAQTPVMRPSPTHGNLVSLAQSPVQLSTLLRSKSAVAMPLQTGLSVTSRSGSRRCRINGRRYRRRLSRHLVDPKEAKRSRVETRTARKGAACATCQCPFR